jgi:CheY-like chemotaxis protein
VSEKTVLVVDDSALIRQVVADAFKPRGYKVLTAGDGSDALRLLSSELPDLIVADILMPVMDGWRLCEELKRHPRTCEIPFIFLTTEKEVEKRVHAFRMGVDDYLTKPFSQEELVARAERLLERSDRFRTLARAAEALSGHTRHLPVADLLQILSLNGKSGCLRLEDGGEKTGRIYFREGRIVQAELGEVTGEKALFRIMMWHDASFFLEELPEDLPETIEGTTAMVLMEGFAHWDELKDLGDRMPPAKVCYEIPSRVESFLAQLDLSAVERDILAAVRLKLRLGEILDTLPHRDLVIYRALLSLVEKGFVEATGEADTQPLRRPITSG